jgi:hypothetical protein
VFPIHELIDRSPCSCLFSIASGSSGVLGKGRTSQSETVYLVECLPNHKVPWLSSEKSLVLLSRINCYMYFNFASSNWPSWISASRVGSTSVVTLALFTIPRLRYSICLRNSVCILLVKVALQYFLRHSAFATTLAFSEW